ncbi:MAG: iron complex outermembrane receptor protein [Desulforhopalus sp.]|jgi:iron complex outermembrane receptor protein
MVPKQGKRLGAVRIVLSAMLASQIGLPGVVFAVGDEQETLQYLKSLSIEDLLQAEITSVSKKSESLFTAAAAVTVITNEDIERTGARSIPEALRLVPGLAVSSIDGSRYAIGARGFNEYFETKLLVLVDGRSMYTPLYSGVYWNSLDTVMQDIERIEVIRGPGATVWGANAVNGVINIITKNSSDTQGAMVSTSVGSYGQPDISARYGGTLAGQTTYRLYAKGYDRNNFETSTDEDAHDSSSSLRTGFRLDNDLSSRDTFSLQGEVFDGEADAEIMLTGYLSPSFIRTIKDTEKYSGGHVLASWDHKFSARSNTTLQMYYDRTDRYNIVATEVRDTVDIDFKNQLNLWDNHEIVWGAGYRWTQDDLDGSVTTNFIPASEADELWSTFIQDDINLVDDFAWVTVGTKFEHNDYTGFEVQPSIRFRLQPDPKQLIWAAVSRAVRTPSRAESDVAINLGAGVDAQGNVAVQRIEGSDDFDSEILVAYEVGYRWQVKQSLSFDLATYYNDYDQIRTLESKRNPFYEFGETPVLVIPAVFDNEAEGESYGLEIQSTWQPIDSLKFIGSYSFIDLDLDYKTGSVRAGQTLGSEDYAPTHQFQLRNYWDLQSDLSLNSEFYYVSDLGGGTIDSYIRIDMQLSWQASDNLRLTVGGENLFGPSHQEFFNSQSNIIASQVPRTYWLKAIFWF